MAIKLKIPAIKNKIAYDKSEVPLVAEKLKGISSKYGEFIKNASIYNKIPKEIITSFIFIESGGDANAVSSSNAIGLMQVSPDTTNDVVRREVRDKKRTRAELSIIKKYLGKDRTIQLLRSPMGDTAEIIQKQHLFNPELNIMLGTAYLGQIFDKLKMWDSIRLDKAIVLYNRGFYTSTSKLKGDYDTLLNSQPAETKAYIIKLVAKQGTLDILI